MKKHLWPGAALVLCVLVAVITFAYSPVARSLFAKEADLVTGLRWIVKVPRFYNYDPGRELYIFPKGTGSAAAALPVFRDGVKEAEIDLVFPTLVLPGWEPISSELIRNDRLLVYVSCQYAVGETVEVEHSSFSAEELRALAEGEGFGDRRVQLRIPVDPDRTLIGLWLVVSGGDIADVEWAIALESTRVFLR